MSAGVTGDPVVDAVAGHGDPLIFEVPDMPPCMLHIHDAAPGGK
jgi:hypothetical protein